MKCVNQFQPTRILMATTDLKIELPIKPKDDKRVSLLQRAQWLRAAILGANDGLLSTTSLMLGVGAAKEDQRSMIISGLAGALAGACSMTVGEFVSVSTQRDIEKKNKEKFGPEIEYGKNEKCDNSVIVQVSGESMKIEGNLGMKVSPATPNRSSSHGFLSPRSPLVKVLVQDAGIDTMNKEMKENNTEEVLPNPYVAAAASGLSFLIGSLVPLLTATVFSRYDIRVIAIVVMASIALATFGAVGARLGGSSVRVSAIRVLVGGWISMAVTYGLLTPFDSDDHNS